MNQAKFMDKSNLLDIFFITIIVLVILYLFSPLKLSIIHFCGILLIVIGSFMLINSLDDLFN
jgi:hypothetical protein